MAQIISYNRGFYVATLMAVAVVLSIAIVFLHGLVQTAVIAGAAVAMTSIAVSLGVSHWVYDRSALYSLRWIRVRPKVWVNIHPGLDEMTELLEARFRPSEFAVWDIFDPKQMTEPSIARARYGSNRHWASQSVSWRALPAKSETFDAVFLLFAAHELREEKARELFFREAARVLKPGGSIVLLEHLRDLPNFLAFGPGFLHFHSRRTWTRAFREGGLEVREERSITPFVKAFELVKRMVP